jgi:hypothetical protein
MNTESPKFNSFVQMNYFELNNRTVWRGSRPTAASIPLRTSNAFVIQPAPYRQSSRKSLQPVSSFESGLCDAAYETNQSPRAFILGWHGQDDVRATAI